MIRAPLAPDALGTLLAERDIARLRKALAGRIDEGSRLALRGELMRRSNRHVEAAALLDAALAQRPEVVALHHAAALAHAQSGNRAAARARWQALLERVPADATVRFQIALTHHDDGHLDSAATWYEAQVEHAPAHRAAWHNLGRVRDALRDAPGAMQAWERAHALAPGDPRPLLLAAAAADVRAELPFAIDCLSRAIEHAPGHAGARFARAAHQSSLALHAQALDDLRQAVALAPHDAAGHSALLLQMHYDETLQSADGMRAAHDEWAGRHAPVTPSAIRPRARATRLRIGYLSPRFGDVPLAALLLPVLEQHDRARFELFAYAAHPASGPTAQAVRQNVDTWRDLPADDEAASQAIAADSLDLLVDLAGHAPGNRLPMLARKPAPCLASWLDYFDTTGVPAVDFLIGDSISTPVARVSRFRERLVVLPHARFAYRPPTSVRREDRAERIGGRVVFGSFNRHAKLTDEVIDTWSNILRAVPHAVLALRASAYRSPQSVAFIRERWRARGVPVEQIAFHPYVGLEAMHVAYGDIDIALDPFPFNGGVTTCDALAHGVPVVTLQGDRMISRQGSALLHAAHRPEWIAATLDDFVSIATTLAEQWCAADRIALSASFDSTPLGDVTAFTRALEAAYLAMLDAAPGSMTPIMVSPATRGR